MNTTQHTAIAQRTDSVKIKYTKALFNSIKGRIKRYKQIKELRKRLNNEAFLADIGVTQAQVHEQIFELKSWTKTIGI